MTERVDDTPQIAEYKGKMPCATCGDLTQGHNALCKEVAGHGRKVIITHGCVEVLI